MIQALEQKLNGCLTLLQLELETRQAPTIGHLSYIIVNRTLSILPATSIILWRGNKKGRGRITHAAGVEALDPKAPYIAWMNRMCRTLTSDQDQTVPSQISKEDIGELEAHEWQEWSPSYGLWCPLTGHNGQFFGGLWLVRDYPWEDGDIALATRLAGAYGHGLQTIDSKPPKHLSTWSRSMWIALVSVMVWVLFFIPVQQSTLAPAAVVPIDPFVVAAPLDGIIEAIDIPPNTPVQPGALLFHMDRHLIQNQLDIAKTGLKIAEEELFLSQKGAFYDLPIRARLSQLQHQITQKASDAAFSERLLERTQVHADRVGVAIFNSPSKWSGRPVNVGERVMMIADPKRVELEILLPIENAMIMEPGSKVLFFLNTDPLHPRHAILRFSSFDADWTPDGLFAYRLIARFTELKNIPRIGLQGTAKIMGESVTLFYYLFWRPMVTIRQFLGI